MDGSHLLPIDTIILANELQQVFHDIGTQIIDNEIKPNSAKTEFPQSN